MIGMAGLYQHLARHLPTARAPCDLQELLEKLLGSTKVRAVQSLIGVDHRNQSQSWEVVALRQHLRTDQYIGGAAARALQVLLEGTLWPCRIAIDADNPRRRKPLRERVFHALGALTDARQISALALCTNQR